MKPKIPPANQFKRKVSKPLNFKSGYKAKKSEKQILSNKQYILATDPASHVQHISIAVNYITPVVHQFTIALPLYYQS